MSNPTPGPWVIQETEDGRLYIEADVAGRDICDLNQQEGDEPTDEESANARLIAAAPEMLALVRRVDDLVKRMVKVGALDVLRDLGLEESDDVWNDTAALLARIGAP